MPIVRFPRHLIHQFSLPNQCRARGLTLAEVLDDVERQFPGVRGYLLDELGTVRPHVNVLIGNRWIVDRRMLSDPVEETDEITVMQALSGG